MKTRHQLFQELDFFRNALKIVVERQHGLKKVIKKIQKNTALLPKEDLSFSHSTLAKGRQSDIKYISRCIELIKETKNEIEATFRKT